MSEPTAKASSANSHIKYRYWESIAAQRLEEIEALQEKYARLHAASCRDDDTIAALREERDKVIAELAAAQAQIAQLRDALETISDEENWGEDGCWESSSYPDEIATEALDTPTDTAALDARLAQERERCAEWLLRTDLKHLPDEWKNFAATTLHTYATAIREMT